MLTLADLFIIVSLFWLALINLANRQDLTKYNLYVSAGFLLYSPSFFVRALRKIAFFDFWAKLGSIAYLPTLILFLGVPIILMMNLIQSFFFDLTPIFQMDVIRVLRLEVFLLILLPLTLFLSIQYFITAIFEMRDGNEIERSGFLLIGIILTFFVNYKNKKLRKYSLQGFSLIIIVNLLILLIVLPVGSGISQGVKEGYGESEGAIIAYISPNTPASHSQLENGDIIVEILSSKFSVIPSISQISTAADFREITALIPSDTEFVLRTAGGDLYIIRGIDPPTGSAQTSGSYLGLNVEDYRLHEKGWISPLLPFWIEIITDWTINLGLLFSVYFILPLPNSPGYRFMGKLIEEYNLDIQPSDRKKIAIISTFLFVSNILFFIF